MFLKRYKDDFISLPLTSNVCYFDEAINQFFLFIRYSCREAVIYSGFDKYSNDSVPLTQVYSFTIVLSRLPNNIYINGWFYWRLNGCVRYFMIAR